jgi:DHA2 family multidrug resistance protein
VSELSPSGRKWIIAATTTLGTFMEVLDTSVANVALPHMQGAYAAGTDEITWVITSYLVANAVILPITGWLGAYFGRKHFYIACIALFTLSSWGAGAAPTLSFLILMRVIQGLAGGAMVPMSQAILLEAFPRAEHGKAMAVFGIGVICGPIVGPTLGGWITDSWAWPWIFYINIPFGLIAILLSFAFIEDPPYLKRPEGRVDFASFVFIAVGLGSLEIMLNRGERYDWFESRMITGFAVAAVVGIVLFTWRGLTADNPLVDLRIFKNREFAAGTGLMFLVGFGLYGSLVMLPLFVQNLLGYTATWAGLVLSPGGITSLLAMVFVGNLIGRVDVRFLVLVGFLANVASMLLLCRINLDVGFSYVMISRLFQGFGLAFLFVPIASSATARIPPEKMGVATGLFNLLRNEGGSVGIALSATFLSTRSQFHHAQLVENLSIYDPALRERLATMGKMLFTRAGIHPAGLEPLVFRLAAGELQRQAYLGAFVDVFIFLTVAFAVAIPFVLLLRNVKGMGGGGH